MVPGPVEGPGRQKLPVVFFFASAPPGSPPDMPRKVLPRAARAFRHTRGNRVLTEEEEEGRREKNTTGYFWPFSPSGGLQRAAGPSKTIQDKKPVLGKVSGPLGTHLEQITTSAH